MSFERRCKQYDWWSWSLQGLVVKSRRIFPWLTNDEMLFDLDFSAATCSRIYVCVEMSGFLGHIFYCEAVWYHYFLKIHCQLDKLICKNNVCRNALLYFTVAYIENSLKNRDTCIYSKTFCVRPCKVASFWLFLFHFFRC